MSVVRITRRICGSSSTMRIVAEFMQAAARPAVDRQREGKDGTVAALAGEADRAAMRFDDGFRDGQAHAGAFHA